MARHVALLGLLGTLSLPAAHAACVKPEKPNPPLNASSDKETFQRVYQQTQKYLQAADEHLKCLNEERSKAAAAGRDNEFSDDARLKDYNATVDDIREVSTQMKEQEQKFKAQPAE